MPGGGRGRIHPTRRGTLPSALASREGRLGLRARLGALRVARRVRRRVRLARLDPHCLRSGPQSFSVRPFSEIWRLKIQKIEMNDFGTQLTVYELREPFSPCASTLTKTERLNPQILLIIAEGSESNNRVMHFSPLPSFPCLN